MLSVIARPAATSGAVSADSFGRQELQVFSMLCRADWSDDCRLSPQLYFTVIHILL